jgi:hypothetical protein
MSHFENTNYLNSQQFGYRKYHFCESAENHKVTILVLMDMSSAIDSVSHPLLLARLHDTGVRGDALKWFSSYLENRSFSLKISATDSDIYSLSYGVPQGLVLGPILFCLYVSELGSIIDKHPVQHVMYADDLQLIVSASPSEVIPTVSRIENCIKNIKT